MESLRVNSLNHILANLKQYTTCTFNLFFLQEKSQILGKQCVCHNGCCVQEYPCVSVVNLGPSNAGYNESEDIDERKENVRIAVAVGAKQLREVGVTSIDVDSCGDAEAAAEGTTLGLWSYDELKKKSSQKPKIAVNLLDSSELSMKGWQTGVIKGNGQNLARRLMETPANLMTPTKFAEVAKSVLKVATVTVRDKAWAEAQKMGSYLSVTQGTDEPPCFLEISYMTGRPEDKPVVLVGKGITFDSGGICLKPSSGMDKMRADMGGAACTLSTIYTLEQLGVPANVIGLIPLTENLINGKATKPGDVVVAMNGKSIQIDNTDAEGRLVLADALCYAHTLNPQAILDMATLTGAMMVALGSGAAGVYTSSNHIWSLLQKSGGVTGDRVWRMPLWNHYSRQVGDSQLADLNNIGKYGREGGCCTAAAFLREFVTTSEWAHIDIAGVMEAKDEVAYLPKGMAGIDVELFDVLTREISGQLGVQ
ncbi:LAP3 [Cordylochernes scorpioides]|uniref:Cytosol aminopeptidase n=1 Tax=Cordylochernes scorpioides TaxID=51811 RepID=A0ABY6KHN7_9ARAC|nr:LAP3 [Cordylochernes scorpioides]